SYQADDCIRDRNVTGVQTCALPTYRQPYACHSWTTLNSNWTLGDCLTTPPKPSAASQPAEPMQTKVSMSARVQEKLATDLPYGAIVAAAWSWRLLLIIVVSAIAVWLLSQLSFLIIPLLIAALLATLLQPVHRLLLKFKFPPVVSSLLLTATLIFVVSTLLTIAGQQLAVGFASMQASVAAGVRDFIALIESWGVSFENLNYQGLLADLGQTVQENSGAIVTGALGFGSTATNILAGLVMALFALIFFLKDGTK